MISNTPIVLNERVRNSLSQNYEVLPARTSPGKAACCLPQRHTIPTDERGMGWHSFRGYRKTWLRGKRCQEDMNNYCMGHQPETMSELYSRLDEDLKTRLWEGDESLLVMLAPGAL
jgi:hypothetical protein